MSGKTGPLRILVVGQTPPPYGGQAVMIQQFLDGGYQRIRLVHLRLTYSSDMKSIGRFALRKVLVLFSVILRTWVLRFTHRTPVLYYPPAGPNKVPVLRDMAYLLCTRWIFKKVVFHFHAGGVAGYAPLLPRWMRPFFRMAYRRPDMAIRTAPQSPDDGKVLGARQDVVVPNGVTDHRGLVPERSAGPGEPITILFAGVLIASKGVLVLLEALSILKAQGRRFTARFMGRWGDDVFRTQCMAFIDEHALQEAVVLLGVMADLEKFKEFAACDVFCFPSFFEAESFGLVLVEAMQFAKPVVSTKWRGIPSVVDDEVNGILVGIQEPGALATALARLMDDEGLRGRLGEAGRRKFEERFTIQRFHRAMEEALIHVA